MQRSDCELQNGRANHTISTLDRDFWPSDEADDATMAGPRMVYLAMTGL